MNHRHVELDSLRGILAVFVFIFHITMILPDSFKRGLLWDALYLSPLHIAFAGNIHVIFFFVLSGFVLSLPFFSKKESSYSSYLIKRVCRLYIPYAVAMIISMISCLALSKGGIKELGGLFNTVWVDPINADLILEHFLFLGNYNVYAFNIVIWSLIHEMRISIIFPLLLLLATRIGWKMNITIGLFLSVVGGGIHFILQDPYQPIYKTSFYVTMFMVGILLAKHKDHLKERYMLMNLKSKIVVVVLGVLIYTYSDLISNPLLADWVTTVGVSVIIIAVLSSSTTSKILLWRPFKFLGKISYSLYLFHLPVLLSLLYLLYGNISIWIIIGFSVIVTLIVSYLSWYVIEQPSIKLAKRLSEKFSSTPNETILVKEKQST